MRPIDADNINEYFLSFESPEFIKEVIDDIPTVEMRSSEPTIGEWIPYQWGESTPNEDIDVCWVTYKGYVRDNESPSGWKEEAITGIARYSKDADDWMVRRAKCYPYEITAYMLPPEPFKED